MNHYEIKSDTIQIYVIFPTDLWNKKTVFCKDLLYFLIFRVQSLTSLNSDLHQDINGGSAFMYQVP